MNKLTKRTKAKIATIITFLAIVVFGITLFNAVFYSAPNEIKVPTIDGKKAAEFVTKPEYPVRLIIPSLNISANVQQVGITYKGNMSTPNNFTDVGWYKYGTVPGNEGSAVIAGHVDNGLAMPGVFKNLENIKVGDQIQVKNKKGETLKYVVTNIDIYNYKDAPLDTIFNEKDNAYLRLITCTGNWVPEDATDDHRLVVTSVFVQ